MIPSRNFYPIDYSNLVSQLIYSKILMRGITLITWWLYMTSRFLGILANRWFEPNSNNSVSPGFKFNNSSFSVNHSDNLFISLHKDLSTLSQSLSARNMAVSSTYFIILDWFNSRTMSLKNITKSRGHYITKLVYHKMMVLTRTNICCV